MGELALAEFEHGRGCTLGQPYGECTGCDWRVKRRFSVKEVHEAINKSEWPDSYAPVPVEQVRWLLKNLGAERR